MFTRTELMQRCTSVGTSTNQPTFQREPSTKAGQHQPAPSTPAYGGVVVLTVLAAAAILLTYTMLPLPGQRELGALNYVASASLLWVTVLLLKRFRPARATGEDPSAKPHVRSRRRP